MELLSAPQQSAAVFQHSPGTVSASCHATVLSRLLLVMLMKSLIVHSLMPWEFYSVCRAAAATAAASASAAADISSASI